jgi:shikimate kinase
MVILIGYRCTGKTSVARQLGEKLHLPVVDSDAVIQQRTGKSIAGIFAESGESGFRDIEESVIAEIVQNNEPMILSTGGGVILRRTNRQRLRNAGKVVWLTATPETVVERLHADAQSRSLRPNLTTLPPLEEVRTLLTYRNPLYAETAHEIIATDSLPVAEIVKKIAECL